MTMSALPWKDKTSYQQLSLHLSVTSFLKVLIIYPCIDVLCSFLSSEFFLHYTSLYFARGLICMYHELYVFSNVTRDLHLCNDAFHSQRNIGFTTLLQVHNFSEASIQAAHTFRESKTKLGIWKHIHQIATNLN